MTARTATTLFLLTLAGTMAVTSLFLSFQARLMPLAALVPATLAIAAQLVRDSWRPAHDADKAEPQDLAARERQAFAAFSGLAVGALLIGVAAAVALFVALWLRLAARVAWTIALASGMIAFMAIAWGFAELGARLPDGIIVNQLVRWTLER